MRERSADMFRIKKFIKIDIRGSTAMEYAVISALVSVVAIPIWQLLGTRLNSMFFGAVTNAFSNVAGGV